MKIMMKAANVYEEHFVSGMVLSIPYIYPMSVLQGGIIYYFCFTDGETEYPRGEVSGLARIRILTLCCPLPRGCHPDPPRRSPFGYVVWGYKALFGGQVSRR